MSFRSRAPMHQISKFRFEPGRNFGSSQNEFFASKRKREEVGKSASPHGDWLNWSVFGYEILHAVDVKEYHLEGFSMILRHNESNMFVEKIERGSNLKALLKKLEMLGKTYGNNHISGFCCVAERTRLVAPKEDMSEFHKVGMTVKSFVEVNFKRIVKDLALSLLKFCDDDVEEVFRPKARCQQALQPSAVSAIVVEEDDVRVMGSETVSMSQNNWALVIHSIPGKYTDLDQDWMKFLRMCLDVANTLGVSNREHMYQNCLKAMMTTSHISHMSPYECVVKLPTGDMVKVGECDIMVEFGTGRHYLVELKVCSQWRKYESQVKKYINACHSINRKIAGAAIVNFNPKGMVEVVMFECNMRHSVC